MQIESIDLLSTKLFQLNTLQRQSVILPISFSNHLLFLIISNLLQLLFNIYIQLFLFYLTKIITVVYNMGNTLKLLNIIQFFVKLIIDEMITTILNLFYKLKCKSQFLLFISHREWWIIYGRYERVDCNKKLFYNFE